ncbi:MAG: acyl--CoA ligase [Lachnospiraceae bacterium]|nr:acyl--CoA ligase [Lachnospiraceae bacterium]
MTEERMEKELTGYPSIDKPWLKYYDKWPEDIVYLKKTLYQFVWDNNKDYLDDIVFLYFDKKINYRTFFENVDKVAKALVASGVKAGDIVTIMSMHTPETIYTIYGLNYIGAVANLVYPSLSAKELSQTIEKTSSRMLFILDGVLQKNPNVLEQVKVPVIILPVDGSMPGLLRLRYGLKNKTNKVEGSYSFKDFLARGKAIGKVDVTSDSEAMAVIVYTSGTTGEPKGVCLSNDNLNALATQDYNGVMEFERQKNCLFILPPFIGFGITQLHILASAGICLILQIALESDLIIEKLFEYQPYVFMTGPALTSSFVAHEAKDLSALKYFIGGGGSISNEQQDAIDKKLIECNSKACYSNGYGMTEAASLLCASANTISKKGSVGIPFIGTNIKVIHQETGCEQRIGEVGELWFSTPNLMQRYLNCEFDTDEVIKKDDSGTRWLRTGDLGYVDEDGFVFIKGRLKRIFITKGKDDMVYKLFPQHIEETLLKMQEVLECGVIVREDAVRMNIAIAYVTLKGNEAIDKSKETEKIMSFAKAELADHMVPVAIHIIEKMPTTPSGKIDYRALEELQEKE